MFSINTQRGIYVVFFVLSVIMTIFTVIVSVTGTAGTEDSIFMSPWVVFIFAGFVAIQIICLFTIKPTFTLYRVGFYILHIGLVLFLTGCFIYYVSGDKLNVSIPVDPTATYNQIKRQSEDNNGSDFVKLSFDVGVSEFKVEKYEAKEGDMAQDKYYEATLMIIPDGTRDVTYVPLIVNKPYRYGGWKIYLMGYNGEEAGTVVALLFKKDPAEFVSTAGLWMIIAGSVVMCLLRKREEEKADA